MFCCHCWVWDIMLFYSSVLYLYIVIIKHFIAEVSQLSFNKEDLLKSQLTLIIIMLMLWQRGVNTSLKSLLSSSAAVDWQIGPPPHFLFPSLVHCWPPLTNTLIWVRTWAGMPFRDRVGPSKSRWMRGMVGCTGQLLCSQEQPSTLPWFSLHYHFFGLAFVASPAASVTCPSATVVKHAALKPSGAPTCFIRAGPDRWKALGWKEQRRWQTVEYSLLSWETWAFSIESAPSVKYS